MRCDVMGEGSCSTVIMKTWFSKAWPMASIALTRHCRLDWLWDNGQYAICDRHRAPFIYIYTCVCTYVYIYICVYICPQERKGTKSFMYMYIYIYMHVCYIYIYTCIYTNKQSIVSVVVHFDFVYARVPRLFSFVLFPQTFSSRNERWLCTARHSYSCSSIYSPCITGP